MISLFGMPSIRRKLFAGVLLSTLAALLFSGAAMLLYDLHDYRTRIVDDITSQGRLLALSNTAALQFNDPEVARESLATLSARPRIEAAALYDSRGALFASYRGDTAGDNPFPPLPDADGIHVENSSLVLLQRIVDNGEILGTIYLRRHYGYHERLWQYAGIVLAVTVLALLIAMALSLWLQARVTRPVLAITGLARQVAERRDYSLRAQKTSDDEIGYLVEAFNDLLSEVGNRSAALEASNAQLQDEIREREEAASALHASEIRYRTLVQALTSMVWSADADGRFSGEKPRWGEYTGQRPEEYRGLGWLAAFHPDDHDLVRNTGRRARSERRGEACEVRLWHAPSGRYRYVVLYEVPLFNAQGELREWMGTADDIDDRRSAEEEIRRLNAELEQRVADRTAELERANRELEAFSYSVSHDLRTPLRAIDGFSQALLEDYAAQLDDTGRDYLGRVRAGAQRMGQLIDDLLQLSRVSRAELSVAEIDLSTMAAEIIGELHEREPQRAVEVVINPGLKASGDVRLLRIALENLLNNAWKYTGRRKLAHITFGARHGDGEPCFYVRDDGAGFDMAYANKLFGAFQRLHDAREFPGTGVGLATVQRIIHRHGGHIWAEAEVDKGSTFYFTLPSVRRLYDEH